MPYHLQPTAVGIAIQLKKKTAEHVKSTVSADIIRVTGFTAFGLLCATEELDQ